MSTYLHGHHESVLRSHRWRTVANSAAYLQPHLSPGMKVLDVGCGPGTITRDLATLVSPGGSVVGIDNAEDIVVVAARAIEGPVAATSMDVTFKVADLYALEYDDDTFDVVHAHQVLQHLSDPVAALREMSRVTKPGGLVAARDADYAAMTWHPANPGLAAWLTLYEALARRTGGEPDAGRRLRQWGVDAGMNDITSSASVWCFASDHDRQWWGGLQADRTTQSAFADQALASGLATDSELQQIAAAWRQWATDDRSWFAVVHGEILCRV